MNNQFFSEAKTLLSLFIEETRESASWFKAEIIRQYHLSILKEIASTYPTTQPYINTVYEIVDSLAEDEDCPDFVEPPDNPAFETEEEADALKFAEKMQELKQNRQALLDTDPFYAPKEIEDGLNEPDYPYDTEPSA